jgi:hypothetical protein
MSKAIKLSGKLIRDTMINAKAQRRMHLSPIEDWARIGRIAI